jgi:hypothetical protein
MKNKLVLLLSIYWVGAFSLPASATSLAGSVTATPINPAAVTVSQQDFQFGVSVGQGDVAYFQSLLWSGAITRDQYPRFFCLPGLDGLPILEAQRGVGMSLA